MTASSNPPRPTAVPRRLQLAWLLAGTSLLAACGGGGGLAGTPPPPSAVVISSQPANQAVVSGQSASFSVTATGNGSLGYQWRLNGVDVAGATAASYTPQALTTAQDNAQVTVRVSDAGGSLLSSAATLRVYNPASLTAPTLNAFAASVNDAGIDTAFGQHLASVPNALVTARGRLFVFLPASLSVPNRTQLILQAAANNGLHAIGLAYPNDVVIDDVCSGSSDTACWRNAREEIRSGSNVSNGVAVNAANSIEHRLQRALQYLVQTQPEAGWSQYVDSAGAIRWDRVRLSGHSQGGGHAAYIATQRAVDRACLFSSPADYDNLRQQPAAWLSAATATPASRVYGFAHDRDTVVGFAKVQSTWTALGLAAFGAVASVDVALPTAGYQGRHMLASDLPAVGGLPGTPYHGMPVVDLLTPNDSGTGLPVYWPVWQYACFLD